MIKSLFRTAIAAFSALVLCVSCNKEPRNTEELIDPWTRERTPVNFRLESQIGAAVIADNWRDDGVGTVHVSLITGGLDLTKVKVVALDFKFPDSEFCPTASIGPGSTIDLSKGAATFQVTAYNGETRTYTVSYEQFTDPLEGVYVHHKIGGILDGNAPMSSMVVLGGWTGEYVISTDQDKSWHWGAGYQPLDEQDNTISFMLTEADAETGLTRGTAVNLAGDDGKYANYVYNNTRDVNDLYRQVPEGSSRWAKDADGRIHFYAADDEAYANELYVTSLLGKGSYTSSDWAVMPSSKTLVVDDCAFMREFEPVDVIDWNYPDTRWMADNVRKTFWLMEKNSDTPLENHAELFESKRL